MKKCLLAIGLLGGFVTQDIAYSQADFRDAEIRVIRPKYFSKAKRMELGAQLSVVANQTFIYTYMVSGILGFHFSETLAFEAQGTYAFLLYDNTDKTILASDKFAINTQIVRTNHQMEGSLVYTPIYGKYQLSSGRVIYFDTFFDAGAGITGVEYLYDHCLTKEDAAPEIRDLVTDPPPPTVMSYPTFHLGVGQRFFLSRKTSFRWDVKDHIMPYNTGDGACPNDSGEANNHNSITLRFGMSKFL